MNWRFRLRRRLAVVLALSVCVLIVAAPTALAQTSNGGYEDLRSADTRDAALAAQQAAQAGSAPQDLRSADTRDAALAAQQAAQAASGPQDLRSPDAREAARGITTGPRSVPAPAPVEPRTVVTVEEGGGQTLAIVFSACALFIALLAVGFVALSRRPRPRWTAP
jgi:hypothetical protein